MFGAKNVLTDVLTIDADPGANAELFYRFKAPMALTIDSFYMTAEQSQSAGTAVVLSIQNWGTAGTSAQGTVGSLGGTATAARLTARTPAGGSVDRSQNYFEAGEWLAVMYNEEGTGWIANDRFHLQINYVLGKGNTTDVS